MPSPLPGSHAVLLSPHISLERNTSSLLNNMGTLTSQSNEDTDVLVAFVLSFIFIFFFSFISQILFNMVLLHSFDMDLLQPAAEAFLALICCHQVIILLFLPTA